MQPLSQGGSVVIAFNFSASVARRLRGTEMSEEFFTFILWFLSVVNVSLALQVIYEFFLTYLSLVGFLSTVSLSLKRTVTSKGFPTHLTHTEFLPIVNLSMILRGNVLSEEFITQLTYIGFVSTVNSFMA